MSWKYLGVHLDPTLNFESHFQNNVHISASVPELILLLPNEFTNRWLCQYLRNVAILVSAGQSRKRMIRSIGSRSLEIIAKGRPQNCDLRACCFVCDCLNGTACSPVKDYFHRLQHDATRNNGKMQNYQKTDWSLRALASIFNLLSLRNINSRVLFRKALDDDIL